MSKQTALVRAVESASPQSELQAITLADDMQCELEHLSPADVRAVCERLRDEIRKQTVALASAVHELRTPLAIMDGYLELLKSGKAGELSEKQAVILEDMHVNSRRLKTFVADFLVFTAVETRTLSLKPQEADLNACVSEVCALWMPRFEKKEVSLYFSPEPDLQPFSFDALKIQHVVSNLVHNALKFTPQRGAVAVTVEKVPWDRRLRTEPISEERRRREAAKLPKAARVTVSDTGRGIEPEFHQEIFNDFRKLSCEENSSDSMGLGLSIARRLVRAHGGKIWVESGIGTGSKFLFLLPLPNSGRGSL
jgi:signal transduction histidine kinase